MPIAQRIAWHALLPYFLAERNEAKEAPAQAPGKVCKSNALIGLPNVNAMGNNDNWHPAAPASQRNQHASIAMEHARHHIQARTI